MKQFFWIVLCFGLLGSCSMDLSEKKGEQDQDDSRSLISLGKGLVLEYLFEGDLTDTSGNDNIGVLKNDYYISYKEGLDGESLGIDDPNSYTRPYVYIEDSKSLHSLSDSDYSVAFWYYYTNTTYNNLSDKSLAFSVLDSSGGHMGDYPISGRSIAEIMLITTSSSNLKANISLNIDDDNYIYFDVTDTVSRYQWHLLVMTVDWDNTEGVKFYIDGELSKKTADPTSLDPTFPDIVDFTIGGNRAWSVDSAPVMYDSYRIYNRLLTSDEIEDLFDYETDGSYVLEDNNFMYTNYDSSSSTYYFPDHSGNADLLVNGYAEMSGYGVLDFGPDDTANLYCEDEYSLDINREDFDIILNLITTQNDSAVLIDKLYDGYGYQISLEGGIPTISMASRGTVIDYTATSLNSPLNDGESHEIKYKVARRSSNGLQLYIDDVLVESFDASDFYRKSLSSDAVFHCGTNINEEKQYVGSLTDLIMLVY
ncbi:LamG-like jellyroll fold domain-containing protein [Spirochaeta cellobiosiphila]|uniref:LamG-like jellyroll fold domain-containing protein n=1 Tax=Spirochaeta cellobiosiphila TaxID=504483 RepID=UPI0004913F61|nr:LamG-like jellyroll fold domain-containing protein [Spirochaeta cellobiosiphila]